MFSLFKGGLDLGPSLIMLASHLNQRQTSLSVLDVVFQANSALQIRLYFPYLIVPWKTVPLIALKEQQMANTKTHLQCSILI